MSRLWRDEVLVYLAPRKLALVRRQGGPRARVIATNELAVPADTAGHPGAVLARLADLLSERVWHGAAARAVVEDHPWARYAVFPSPSTRLDAAGRLAHARYVLADAWGAGVADWDVTLADTPPGRPLVACAMPRALRGALEETLAPARLTLVSMQPRLIVAFNTFSDRLPQDDAWFVSVDDASLSAVHLSHGCWDRVHLARLSSDWSVELARLKAVGGLAGAGGRMYVDAPDRLRREGGTGPGVEWLGEGDGAQGHELALLRRVAA